MVECRSGSWSGSNVKRMGLAGLSSLRFFSCSGTYSYSSRAVASTLNCTVRIPCSRGSQGADVQPPLCSSNCRPAVTETIQESTGSSEIAYSPKMMAVVLLNRANLARLHGEGNSPTPCQGYRVGNLADDIAGFVFASIHNRC